MTPKYTSRIKTERSNKIKLNINCNIEQKELKPPDPHIKDILLDKVIYILIRQESYTDGTFQLRPGNQFSHIKSFNQLKNRNLLNSKPN